MMRSLRDADLTPEIFAEIKEYEENHVLPIGKLDELRAKFYPNIAEREGNTLDIIVRAVYREYAIRHGIFSDVPR